MKIRKYPLDLHNGLRFFFAQTRIFELVDSRDSVQNGVYSLLLKCYNVTT